MESSNSTEDVQYNLFRLLYSVPPFFLLLSGVQDGAKGGYSSLGHFGGGRNAARNFQFYNSLPLKTFQQLRWNHLPVDPVSFARYEYAKVEAAARILYYRRLDKTRVVAVMDLIYGKYEAVLRTVYIGILANSCPQSDRDEGHKKAVKSSSLQRVEIQDKYRKELPRESNAAKKRDFSLPTEFEIKFLCHIFQDIDYVDTIPVLQSPDTFWFQEQLLASVNNLFRDLFSERKWRFDGFDLIPPKGQESLAEEWKVVSDECWGAGLLFRQGKEHEGFDKLSSIFAKIESLMTHEDPHLLVRIWRIARYIYGITALKKDYKFIKMLFDHFAGLTSNYHKEGSPLFGIINALARMNPEDILWGLRLGQLRTIHSLQQKTRKGHPTVLCMWSYYVKQWGFEDQHDDLLINHYKEVLERARTPNQELAITHDFVYYLVYCSKWTKDIYRYAESLHDLARRLMPQVNGNFQWSSPAQYLAFSGQVLASHAEQHEGRYFAVHWLRLTASILEKGDTECLIRAERLRGRLKKLLQKWDMQTEASEEGEKKERLNLVIKSRLEDNRKKLWESEPPRAHR